jgi:hypothetical protein
VLIGWARFFAKGFVIYVAGYSLDLECRRGLMANGLWDLSWWQLLLYTLITTHFTIAGVTIYLHRSQAHRALDLGPIPRISSASGSGWARAW